MLSIIKDLLQLAKQYKPDAPIIDIAEAAINTAVNPTPANILADIELATKLVNQFKNDISNLHPNVQGMVKELMK